MSSPGFIFSSIARPFPILRSKFSCRFCQGRRGRYQYGLLNTNTLRAPRIYALQTGQPSQPDDTKINSFITVEAAHAMESQALNEAGGDIHEVALTCAAGVADALSKCYSSEEHPVLFVVCGSGVTGLIALYSCVILKEKGYEPSVYSSHPSKHVDVVAFCEKNGLTFYDFAPSTLDFYYDVMVDGLLGTGFDGGDIREQYWRIYEVLFSTELPTISIDVPSGWDLSLGPREIDITADTFIKPDLLISLGAPKLGTKAFAGSFHYIAGKHVSHEWLCANEIQVPTFPSDSDCVLFSSSTYAYQKGNGEVYGRPGQYNATLFKSKERKKWVDVEESMDLWDELD